MKNKISPLMSFLILGLLSLLSPGCHKSDEVSVDGISRILEISDGQVRKYALISRTLEQGCAGPSNVYLARELMAEGRLKEAELYLRAAGVLAPDDEAGRLGIYLEAYLAFLREDYGKTEILLEQCTAGTSEEDDLLQRADLLLSRSRIAQGKDLEEAADSLLQLWERKSPYLGEGILIELTDLLIRLDRKEEAVGLIEVAVVTLPFNDASSSFWVELAGETDLNFIKETILIEGEMIRGDAKTQGRQRDFVSGTKTIAEVREAMGSGDWEGALERLAKLKEGASHRLYPFLEAVCALRKRGAGKEELNNYLDRGWPYRETQFYYHHLWKGLDLMGGDYRPLMLETLNAGILTGPLHGRAREARVRLARAYGLEGLPGPLPMTEAEMKHLVDFVLQGAPVEILRPVLEFLEWPENPCTLRAELALRELRGIPAVQDYITRYRGEAGERAEERIDSILRF